MERSGKISPLESRKAKLTGQIAKQVFFYSFYFSQGNPTMQQNLFRYIHRIRPDWTVDPEVYASLRSLERTVLRLPYRGLHGSFRSHKYAISEVETQADIMAQTLNTGSMSDPAIQCICSLILEAMIERDHDYLCIQKGRPERDATYNVSYGSYRYDYFRDPLLSHLCHFCILGNKCHIAEFDELFGTLGNHVTSGTPLFKNQILQYEPLGEKLREMVDVFNISHGTSIRIDDALP